MFRSLSSIVLSRPKRFGVHSLGVRANTRKHNYSNQVVVKDPIQNHELTRESIRSAYDVFVFNNRFDKKTSDELKMEWDAMDGGLKLHYEWASYRAQLFTTANIHDPNYSHMFNDGPGMTGNSLAGPHFAGNETDLHFDTRWLAYFNKVNISHRELRMGIVQIFQFDCIPEPQVIEAMLRAARRIDNFGLAVRILELVYEKAQFNMKIYDYVLQEIGPCLKELSIPVPAELGFV